MEGQGGKVRWRWGSDGVEQCLVRIPSAFLCPSLMRTVRPLQTQCLRTFAPMCRIYFLHSAMTSRAFRPSARYQLFQGTNINNGAGHEKETPIHVGHGHALRGFYHGSVTARETGFWESHGALSFTSPPQCVIQRMETWVTGTLQSRPTFSHWMARLG